MSPLAPLRKAVRTIRDYTQSAPLPWYRPREVVTGSYSSRAVAAALRDRGVCILERMLSEQELRFAQEAAGALLERANPAREQRGYRSALIDLSQQPLLVAVLLNDLILAAVEEYFGRPIYLALGHTIRLDPVEPEPTDKGWHHDCKGKYVKAMWLLTDASSTGQRMSYIAGSHTTRHRFATYEESRFTDAEALAYGEDIVECVGPAGSVVIFDTNGVHRPNRNLGPRRETIVSVYSDGRYRQGCRFDPAQLGPLNEWQRSVLKRSRTPRGYVPGGEA